MSPKRHAKMSGGGGPPPAPRANPLRVAWRSFQTLLMIAVILYVAALVISRTSGFRSLVEDRLGRELKAKIGVTKSHLTAGLDLVLGDLVLEETGVVVRAKAGCQRAVIAWHLPRPWGSGLPPEIRLQAVQVSMAWHQNAWHPRSFAEASDEMAKWMNIPLPAAAATAGARPKDRMDAFMPPPEGEKPVWRGPRVRVSVDGGEVAWWTDQPEPVAAVAGLRLSVTPLDAPDRPMTHFLLQAREVSARGQVLAAPLRVESLDTGDQRIMLEMMAGQRPQG